MVERYDFGTTRRSQIQPTGARTEQARNPPVNGLRKRRVHQSLWADIRVTAAAPYRSTLLLLRP